MQRHWMHRCGLLLPFSGGILRAETVVLCAGGYLFLRPSPLDRISAKDLLLTSQTTNKQPPVPLPSLFGASRPSILRNWTPTGPTLGGNGRPSQWPKKKCNARIRGRRVGSDPELNRAEVQFRTPHLNNSTLERLTKTRKRAVPPVYEEHLRCINLLLLPKWFRSFFACLLFRGRQKCDRKSYTSRNSFSIVSFFRARPPAAR